ncbi:MAG: hypothetical protein AW09_004346 [Candidatus Accumulibacter phosphatis]|uniref:Uncharacterized protein n=1 Tax=Candidatus Accumulibacter phosphatis TaxID=327160 RepID=A0A080LR10_9PROT|nr:MAG: hypothetical protein AW09_004346 [Candidatus Accumulibacter phosphatis]
MAITLSVVLCTAALPAGRMASALLRVILCSVGSRALAAGWVVGSGCPGKATRVRAAARMAAMMSFVASSRKPLSPNLGLLMMLTAPAASACMSVSLPVAVGDEQMITGVGRSAISLRRKERPCMRVISISRMITSGQFLRILSMAKSGSAAVLMTSMPGSRASACATT